MLIFFKKFFCNHDYHLLTTYEKDIDDTVGYKIAEIYRVYCPKCKNKKELLLHDYNSLMKKQQIDKEYNK